MNRLSVWGYALGIILFVVSSSFALFYGYKVITHEPTATFTERDEYSYHFVLVPEELDNEYWRLVENGARQAAKEYDVLLEYAGPEQANIDEHLRTIEMAAASKVDGIMTQGLSDEQFIPLINRVVKKIPVITVDTDASNSNRKSYIGTDNYISGFLAGEALIEDTKGEVNVAIITGNLYANHQIQRVQGFQDAVKTVNRINIIKIEESEISRVRAAEKANQIIREHPNVNAFFGTSALDGLGIAQVAEKYQLHDQMYIVSFDTLPETLEYMKRGIIEATVVQQPFEMGYRAVKMMIDLIDGKIVPPVVHTNTKVLRGKDLPTSSQAEREGES